MCLGLAVIVDAHEQEVVSVLCHLRRILLTPDLVDGGIGILVKLQFHDDGGAIDILSRYEDDVGKAPARRQFAVHDVVILGIIVCQAQHAGQRILVVV